MAAPEIDQEFEQDYPSIDFHSSEWADLVPVPQDDGPNPVVPITYPENFVETMNYFRAILTKDERSERALKLSALAICLNPGNYTAWYFRRQCLASLHCDIAKELKRVSKIALRATKNYQLWFHRRALFSQLLLQALPSSFSSSAVLLITSPVLAPASSFVNTSVMPMPASFGSDLKPAPSSSSFSSSSSSLPIPLLSLAREELAETARFLDLDAKNYHVWSHRQWVVQKFGLWENEMNYAQSFLDKDCRNNSAWNYRYWLLSSLLYAHPPSTPAEQHHVPSVTLAPSSSSFPPSPSPSPAPSASGSSAATSSTVVDEELSYTMHWIEQVPHNESAWNYLSGLIELNRRFSFLPSSSPPFPFPSSSSSASSSSSSSMPLLPLEQTVLAFCRSSAFASLVFAMSLASTLLEREGSQDSLQDAAKLCLRLASTVDPLRHNYWGIRAATFAQKALSLANPTAPSASIS